MRPPLPRSLPRTLLALLCLALTGSLLALPPAYAAGGRDGDPAQALARARTALSGVPQPGTDASLALRALYRQLPRLQREDPVAADEAERLLARPTEGLRDARGDGYAAPATRLCGGRVCVHFVRRTADAPDDRAWVRTTLRLARRVLRQQVDQLGYRAPRNDGTRGGDRRLDVYLADVGARGLYGYCAPERRQGVRAGSRTGSRSVTTAYCVLDDDFSRDQFGTRPGLSLRVTAAHELFHAVQFAYDVRADPWLQESTATWMEERLVGGADDNRRYLPYGQVARPWLPLDAFEATGFSHYGAWPFWEYLAERHGDGVVRRVWERAGAYEGAPHEYSTKALATVLADHGGLTSVFARYVASNVARAQEYDEGEAWPRPQVSERRLLSPDGARGRRAGARVRVDHLASRVVALSPRRSAEASLGRGRYRLRVRVVGPPARTSPAAYVVIRTGTGDVLRRVALDRDGSGTGAGAGAGTTGAITTRFPGEAQVLVVLVNASDRFVCRRPDPAYSCRGTPRDDDETFRVGGRLLRR